MRSRANAFQDHATSGLRDPNPIPRNPLEFRCSPGACRLRGRTSALLVNVIVVHNATSRLHTDPATLRAVRGFVSYRADELPSRQAQALIREFFETRRRQGFDRDVDALYADPALAQLLGEADFPPDTLTAETLHDIL